ncbi:hypothetical protein Q9251_02200 [Alkalihalobacillus macyae]|uniref:hypothetical protein n=1 Tax=Guptibacillus hwajinpoensis TaxID=208199 RepID=UPI00273B60B8|nr:hypothetical protein [Alkalihalobacillus macyae]MDP4549691.1 hypothetical protein [Alkalihalobacillus macyae]
MAIATYSKFTSFKESIHSLTNPVDQEELMNKTFLLERDEKKNLEMYYAPFEHVNEHAKIVIVGITPGLHQMKKSFETVWNNDDDEIGDEEILQKVKNHSSFEGPMRKNLITMLDELELHQYLNLASTSELFGPASHLVQTTSVLPYPVFYKGKNFSGSTPNILRTEVLHRYALNHLPIELEKLNNPLIVPLGVNVTKVLMHLAENDLISANSLVNGFPHPSGGNGHRHRQFAENKEGMKETIRRYFS